MGGESGGWFGGGGGHAPWQDTCLQRVFRPAHRRGGTRTHNGTSRCASFASVCLFTRTSMSSFTSPPLSHSRCPRRVYCQVYAILGTNFFSHRTPEHFGNFHTSLFTMFQVMSGGAFVHRVCACVLLCTRVARALVCGTHIGVCERAGRGSEERGRVKRVLGRHLARADVESCVRERGSIRVYKQVTPSTHWLLQTGGRAPWRVESSVSARTRRGLSSSLAVSLSPGSSLDQSVFSHIMRHSAWADGC